MGLDKVAGCLKMVHTLTSHIYYSKPHLPKFALKMQAMVKATDFVVKCI